MANQKVLDKKQNIISEVSEKIKSAKTMVVFEYHGLTVTETNELRRKLRESDADFKIFKNTLVNRALKDLKIDLGEELMGPKAFAFGTDAIAPIKILSEYAKKHPALELKVGIVDGEVADTNMLQKLAAIPSRDTLLTMVAAGLMQTVKDFAICLDLHSQNLEN